MHSNLFKKLSPDCIVLTANSRLSRYLHTRYEIYQRSLGHTAWETPRILPLSDWLIEQFHHHNTSGTLLLTDFQETCLWRNIVQALPLSNTLLQPSELTRHVKQAFSHFAQWNIVRTALTPFESHAEAHCLITCFTQFQTLCQKENWITESEIPSFLTMHDTQSSLSLPSEMLLIGFDDHSPALQSLLTQLEQRITVQHENCSEHNPHQMQLVLPDTETEIKQMAEWAKNQLDNHPNSYIGCIVPDLATIRTTVQRTFSEIIPAEKINVSAGIAFATQPMIEIALTLLRWCEQALPIQSLSSLLQSPYLCSNEQEKNMGAQMDAYLRERNKLSITIPDLYSAISHLQNHYPDNNWLQRFRTLLHIHNDKKRMKLSPSDWMSHFIQLLKSAGWPSLRTQTSYEFQILERFKKVCLEFSALNFIFPTLSFKKALKLLSDLMQETIFQAKSNHEPIQIMGTLEASSIIFDVAWVMGLHDGVWPNATKPNPLIPYSIQQQHHMPHATPERELTFCENMTSRLKNTAKTVIFSSPAKSGDAILFPSRLINAIPIVTLADVVHTQSTTESEFLFSKREMEYRDDDLAPPLTEFSQLQGGTAILKWQALCPFRAFATIRLRAKPLNTPMIGITPIARGILVHHVLLLVWNTIKDQPTLTTLTEITLENHITEAIEQTFSDNKMLCNQIENRDFFTIEKRRLFHLIKSWLTFEKTRPYFRVTECETEHHCTIGKLPITIRQDRIDQLEDGSLFLIDYKTGENSMNGWFEERLTDPQLPLYALFQKDNLTPASGFCFAEVKTGSMGLKGIVHENHPYTKTTVSKLIPLNFVKKNEYGLSWDQQLEKWHQTLLTLSNDFCEGDARVDPVHASTCSTCALKPLCRIGSASEQDESLTTTSTS